MDTSLCPLLLKRFKDFLAPCQVRKSEKCDWELWMNKGLEASFGLGA